jgi:hypothetical protein
LIDQHLQLAFDTLAPRGTRSDRAWPMMSRSAILAAQLAARA